MFPSRITLPHGPSPETEDIFSSALSTLFTDDVQLSHGVPGSHVTYHSPLFGALEIQIPQYPNVEEGKRLFAHALWIAGVVCADAVERASNDGSRDGQVVRTEQEEREWEWDRRYWDVRGRRVLELGAGTALPSIIAALSGAASTTITDHPSSLAIAAGAIERNVRDNILERRKTTTSNLQSSTAATPSPTRSTSPGVAVFGYVWGTTTMYDPSGYGKPSATQPDKFDRLIIADCLWMPEQHVNLVKTIHHYLDSDKDDGADPENNCRCALVVAGFHTGREILRHFFEVATGEYALPQPQTKPESSVDGQGNGEGREKASEHEHQHEHEDETGEEQEMKGRLRCAEIFEIDVNGVRRPWEPVREGETKNIEKRWCVVAVLVRR